MTDLRRLVFNPMAPLVLLSLMSSVLFAAYSVLGRSPSPTFMAVVQLSWTLLLAYWVVLDARKGNRIPCFDFGLFCYLLLPITLPWYCFWSRGWRGAFLLVAVYGLAMGPYVVEAIVWQVLYGTA